MKAVMYKYYPYHDERAVYLMGPVAAPMWPDEDGNAVIAADHEWQDPIEVDLPEGVRLAEGDAGADLWAGDTCLKVIREQGGYIIATDGINDYKVKMLRYLDWSEAEQG